MKNNQGREPTGSGLNILKDEKMGSALDMGESMAIGDWNDWGQPLTVC